MTLTIEVDDEKALELLKQLEVLNVLKLKSLIKAGAVVSEIIEGQEPYGTKQQAELMALSGSLNMNPERLREYETFLNEIRNEWE